MEKHEPQREKAVVELDPSWVARPTRLTSEELSRIEQAGDALLTRHGNFGKVGGPMFNLVMSPAIRRSYITWFLPDQPDTDWLYDMSEAITRGANRRYWNYHLTGFFDPLQYSVYDASYEGHYDWHRDKLAKKKDPERKLSFSLLLSDPSTYEGGDLEVNDGVPFVIPHKQQGDMIIFPSYLLHRVTPVTRGTRKSLVGWVSGPRFR